jgi:hypothetical protein
MTMFLIACFLMGIGNFAMHKAVVESGHPFIEDATMYFGRYFGRGGYAVEFIILVGAMLMAHGGSLWIVLGYFAYTLFNGLAAWLFLSGKL